MRVAEYMRSVAVSLPPRAIRTQIASAIQLVCQVSRMRDGQADALADPHAADVGVAEGGECPFDHAALGVEDAGPVPDLDAGLVVAQSPTPYQSSKLASVSCS